MANKTPRIPQTATRQPAFEGPKQLAQRQTDRSSLVLGREYLIACNYVNTTYKGLVCSTAKQTLIPSQDSIKRIGFIRNAKLKRRGKSKVDREHCG